MSDQIHQYRMFGDDAWRDVSKEKCDALRKELDADIVFFRTLQVVPAGEAREPVMYQSRMRPAWDAKHPWTPWEECSKEAAANKQRVPLLHDWEFEVRELFDAPVNAGEAVAYLVSGGRMFKDKPFLSKEAAEQSVRERNDGASIKPLGVIATRQQRSKHACNTELKS